MWADESARIEEAERAEGRLDPRLWGTATAGIFAAVAFLEAAVNELFQDAFDDHVLLLASIDPLLIFGPVQWVIPWPEVERAVRFYGHFALGLPGMVIGFFLLALVIFTMAYNTIEAVLALWAGIQDRSVSLEAFGLDSIIEWALGAENREGTPEPTPEKGFYYRSDHFNFAKQGVPAFSIEGAAATSFAAQPYLIGQIGKSDFDVDGYDDDSGESLTVNSARSLRTSLTVPSKANSRLSSTGRKRRKRSGSGPWRVTRSGRPRPPGCTAS